jgi:tetratricopeptide (TPR) repeat protein
MGFSQIPETRTKTHKAASILLVGLIFSTTAFNTQALSSSTANSESVYTETSTLATKSNSPAMVLMQQWDKINYASDGSPLEHNKKQFEQYQNLIDQAQALLQDKPDSAELWLWSGIIKSSYAGAKGGLGAMSLVKASKLDLEHALALLSKDTNTDSNGGHKTALEGSVYTSLGTLYARVPGWPISFGSDKKARRLLAQAQKIAPKDIDTNYFYAEFLAKEGDTQQAVKYYHQAAQAHARSGRSRADLGRQKDIANKLGSLN